MNQFCKEFQKIHKEIEQVLFEERFSQLIEMEMLKDRTITAKTEMLNNLSGDSKDNLFFVVFLTRLFRFFIEFVVF